MITRLEIENFKAIKKVAVDLTPLTVLVGPNDSGKSTLLQALHLIGSTISGRALAHDEPSIFGNEPQVYFGDLSRPMRFAITLGGPVPVRYELAFEYAGKRLRASEERIILEGESLVEGSDHQRHKMPPKSAGDKYWAGERTLLSELTRDAEPYRTLRSTLPSFYVAFEPPKMVVPSEADAELESNGSGLAGVLDRILTSPERDEVMAKFNGSLRRLSSTVRSIAMRPGNAPARGGGMTKGKELLFILTDGRTVPAREASAGLVLAAGYLALIYGTDHHRFLVEEPETGVHPNAALAVVDVLREMVHQGRQVIATTHSPIVLNYMEPEDVQIVTRTEEAGVTVTPMVKSQYFDERIQKFDLGALWYSVGEAALVSPAS